MRRRRQLEAIESDLLRGAMRAIIGVNPLDEVEHLLRVPVQAEPAKRLTWASDTCADVAVQLHRLGHRRLDGNAAKSTGAQRREDVLHDARELMRSFGELADAEHTGVADEGEKGRAVGGRPKGIEDRDGNR